MVDEDYELPKEIEILLRNQDVDSLRDLMPTLKQTMSLFQQRRLFHRACKEQKNVEMARMCFTEFGIDPSCTKLGGIQMAIESACLQSDFEMVQFLVQEYGCRATQYCLSLAHDKQDLFRFLLANGANATDVINASGDLPLHRAYSMETATLLLSTCKDPKAMHAMLVATNEKGDTANQKLQKYTGEWIRKTAAFLFDVEKALTRPLSVDFWGQDFNRVFVDTNLAELATAAATTVLKDLQRSCLGGDISYHVLSFLSVLDIAPPSI